MPIGLFSGGVGTQPLQIQLSGAQANAAAVQALIRRLSYSNVADDLANGNRSFNLRLDPPGGNSAPSVAATRAIAVTGINDAPVLLKTLVLYDATTTAPPDNRQAAPGGPWLFYQDSTAYVSGEASRSTTQGKTTLTTDIAAFAGFSNYNVVPRLFPARIDSDLVNPLFPVLDRTQGYTLSFAAKLLEDSFDANSADENQDGLKDHNGFNVVLLSSDSRGIELSFDKTSIWADEDGTTQADPSLEPDSSPRDNARTFFVQAESARFDTTQFTQYDLSIRGERYQLYANAQPLLSGRLRDYSAFKSSPFTFLGSQITPPNPYAKPNLIFLGDNSRAAGATVELSAIAISTALPSGQLNLPAASPVPPLRVEDADNNNPTLTTTLTTSSGTLTVGSAPGGLGSDQIRGNGSSTVTLTGTPAPLNATLAQAVSASGAPAGTNPSLSVQIREASPELPPEQLGQLSFVSGKQQIRIENGQFQSESLQPLIRDPHWQVQASGAISGGAAPEVIWRHLKTGQVVLWEDLNTRAIELPAVTDRNWSIKGTGQFDQDGNRDLLWYNNRTDEAVVWYMNASSQVRDRTILTQPSSTLEGYELEGCGDFDGNGSVDLLWVNGAGQAAMTTITLGSGVMGNAVAIVVPSPLTPTSVPFACNDTGSDGASICIAPLMVQGIGDYDGDGRDDLALGYGGTIQTVWLMNGTLAPRAIGIDPFGLIID
ncbi:MAG: hypothetical protein HC857_10655 [Synechococcales cyanobacterium RU_4_20]|nr:hypothetical protein [Synechococcales cyanobacterium RU_4_20]NJR69152.1 hypothetical protein [Synechococcales cyanobacterium CRU_2_2]